jgi:DNA processing protein chainA
VKYTKNVLNILTALEFKGIGKAFIVKNYTPNLSEEEFCKILNVDLDDFIEKKENIQNELERSSKFVDGFLALGDEKFPVSKSNSGGLFESKIYCNRNTSVLKDSEHPIFFAYKGDLKLLDKKNINIAVIGLLEPGDDIVKLEKDIVSEFIKNDFIIVSGLALGCDSVAHQETVRQNNVTIAILPSTIQNVIPKQNVELANDIVFNGGLLLSEYYKEPNSQKEQINRYVERDRLQALFSDMVVLAASYSQEDTKVDKKLDSGSRHALNKALEYGIKRAVMWDDAICGDGRFNLNRELINNRNIQHINQTDRNFKVFTRENASEIAYKFKAYIKDKHKP